jgi:hypothetical protein
LLNSALHLWWGINVQTNPDVTALTFASFLVSFTFAFFALMAPMLWGAFPAVGDVSISTSECLPNGRSLPDVALAGLPSRHWKS